MILTNKDLRSYLKSDFNANNITSKIEYYWKLIYGNVNACVVRYLISLRKYEFYSNINSPLKFYWRYRNRQLGLKYNLAIPINVIGPGLYIPHIEGGVIVNWKKIGANCKINSGVVIGSKHNNSEIAVIGDNVEICVGAKVIGAINIGDNVIIAPNAVVINDVPSKCVVGGVPAKIIRQY